MSNEERPCTKCGLVKPLVEFSNSPRGRYGKKASCKACDAARHRLLHPEQPRKQAPKRRQPIDPSTTKRCTKCGETKAYAEFSLSRAATETQNAVYRSHCKACSSKKALQWFHDNKERHKNNKHRWTIGKLYGLTPEEFNELLTAQGGVCAICGEVESKAHGRTGTPFRLAVDHCHETGRVRGLLCQTCNRVIGLFRDDIGRHQKAIDYLIRSRSS